MTLSPVLPSNGTSTVPPVARPRARVLDGHRGVVTGDTGAAGRWRQVAGRADLTGRPAGAHRHRLDSSGKIEVPRRAESLECKKEVMSVYPDGSRAIPTVGFSVPR